MCSARPMCRIATTKEHVFKEARTEQNWPPARSTRRAAHSSGRLPSTQRKEQLLRVTRAAGEMPTGTHSRFGAAKGPPQLSWHRQHRRGTRAGDRPGCLQHLLDKGSAVFLRSFDTSCPRSYIRKASTFRKELRRETNPSDSFWWRLRTDASCCPRASSSPARQPKQLTEEPTTHGGSDRDTASMQAAFMSIHICCCLE